MDFGLVKVVVGPLEVDLYMSNIIRNVACYACRIQEKYLVIEYS